MSLSALCLGGGQASDVSRRRVKPHGLLAVMSARASIMTASTSNFPRHRESHRHLAGPLEEGESFDVFHIRI
ncbi:hypothetical protein LMG29739_05335 [Paraburkholderia solisilvae]|uniref:Uncharacterized protein n=1 Tax=Paraburkholderia solisilvae TaxID=624376 RepID=A0A6J5EQ43_9BURK|nr:hypothetical protein LMG29739_05335 [Paraburkholderia solisilvae]